MQDLQQIQLLAQLTDNLEMSIQELEKSYKQKNAEAFKKSKQEILETQTKISQIIRWP